MVRTLNPILLSLRYPEEGEEEGPTHDHEVDDHCLGTRLVVK